MGIARPSGSASESESTEEKDEKEERRGGRSAERGGSGERVRVLGLVEESFWEITVLRVRLRGWLEWRRAGDMLVDMLAEFASEVRGLRTRWCACGSEGRVVGILWLVRGGFLGLEVGMVGFVAAAAAVDA